MTRVVVLASAFCVVACASSSAGNVEPPSRDGGSVDGGSEGLSAVLDENLDALTPAEARAVCEETERRTDACTAIALARSTQAECEQALAGCEENRGDGGAVFGCEAASFGSPGSCPVKVEQYLACTDAWNALQTCDTFGLLIPTPAVCLPLVNQCPPFAKKFFRDGIAPPCDPPSPPLPPDDDDDIFGADGCRPLPARFVVLGDSIADCSYIAPTGVCASYMIPAVLRETYGDDVVFEMHALNGAKTAELPAQAKLVAGGPGHVAVYIWIIGNDLLAGTIDYKAFEAAWAETFAYFTDTSRFPDGVTFLLNGQYSTFDECSTDPAQQTLEAALKDVNRRLFLDVAVARPDAIAIDHLPDWMGHGLNANRQGCPHCGLNNESWLGIGPHPNVAGYAHIADKWKKAFVGMYGGACSGR